MKKNRAIKNLILGIFFLYPLLAYLSVKYLEIEYASILLCTILVLRIFFLRDQTQNLFGRVFEWVLWIVFFISIANLYFQHELALKLYPILISAGVFGIFAHSLLIKQPIIEKFARLFEKNLSPLRLKYIHRLTVIWALWLFINTLVSLLTALYASIEIWTLYNGVLFYIICGFIFVCDLSYRRFVLVPRETR